MKRAKHKIIPEITLHIHGLSHDGRGIGTVDGKTFFVSGALPGEEVICKVWRSHRRFNEAKTLQVLQASPHRITPGCPHFGTCGGCTLQHLDPEQQLIIKQQALLEQLKHFGKVIPEEILPPISGQLWGYRKKARLGVRYVIKKEKLLVGFREVQSNYLADLAVCPVLHPSVGTKLTALSELIASLTQFEHIPQVEVAISDNVSALIFRHLAPLSEDDIYKLKQFGEFHHLHIYLQPNPPTEVHKIWPQQDSFNLSYRLPKFDITIQFPPQAFTQVNSEINHLMIDQALSLLALSPTDKVLDLFCGLGNFTLPMAKQANSVVGVEASVAMVKFAIYNAEQNNLFNTTFYTSNLMAPVTEEPWYAQNFNKILLDPPRSGAKEILSCFSQWQADRVVYVSCNPSTLARDSFTLVHELGYQLKKTGIINMFPQTSHVEAIALFVKR